MKNFLKSFFSNDKTPEEQAILSAQNLQRPRDVMVLDMASLDMAGVDAEEESDEDGSCATQTGCCGGCHR